MGNSSRLTQVRDDLSVRITDLYVGPGNILVIHPKPGIQFTLEYAKWLADTLQTLLPVGVKGIVLPENVTNFNVVCPDGQDETYRQGFEDAIKLIAEINK